MHKMLIIPFRKSSVEAPFMTLGRKKMYVSPVRLITCYMFDRKIA
jgi:hypothetical protein